MEKIEVFFGKSESIQNTKAPFMDEYFQASGQRSLFLFTAIGFY